MSIPVKKKAPPTDTWDLPIDASAQDAITASTVNNAAQLSPSPYTSQPQPLHPPANPVKAKTSSSNLSKARPTDTFSLPFPNGYYQMEFPINMPSAYPELVKDSLRYTAAPCSFDEFADRAPIGRKPFNLKFQTCKLMITVTMYNEDIDLFALTMEAVYKNIEFLIGKSAIKTSVPSENPPSTVTPLDVGSTTYEKLESADLHRTQGLPITWKDVVVCIVCDGRQKCPKNVKVALEMLGCYQSNELIMTDFQEDPVQAHIFEYTTSVHLVAEKKAKSAHLAASKYPMQILVCMKEFNKKKIDSHGWAFNAFAPLLNPEVVVLLDMGTKPFTNSMFQFWKHFDGEPRLGGVCGEIIVEVKGSWFLRRWINLWKDPLLSAQNFEYKMANILDKSLQSLCGYITVLPGAFSAYRYEALRGTPLDEYFKAEGKGDEEETTNMSCMTCLNIASANKYLAEDRILCFEIFNKRKNNWLLRYIKEAKAETDAPDNLGGFLNQRRRWLNGSLFSFLSGFANMGQIWRTTHSVGRKLAFILEMFYLLLDTLFTLLGPMNYYGIFVLSLLNIAGVLNIPAAAVYALAFVYIMAFIFGVCLLQLRLMQVIVFVGNNPRGSQFLYTFLSRFWMIMMLLIFLALGYNSYLLFVNTPDPIKVVLFLLAIITTYGLYIASSILMGDAAHLISSILGYFLLLPTYINVMLPFALANINDISWGTRPAEAETGRKLPKNKLENGQALITDTKNQGELNVDVSLLQSQLKPPIDETRVARPRLSLEDQNKNVRFILLFVFFFTNLLGAAAITYGAAASQSTVTNNGAQKSFNSFVEIYMVVLFCAIAFFALVRFIGAAAFKITTPVYKDFEWD